MLRILIAEDHEMVREGLKIALRDLEEDIQLLETGDFSGVQEIVAAVPDLDLVLLDFKMPGMNGLEGLRSIKQPVPDVPVCMLSAVREQKLVRRVLASGADGFIPKTVGRDVMLSAVKLVLSGGVYLPSLLLGEESDADTQGDPSKPPAAGSSHPELTGRQSEVLELMKQGLTNKEIARRFDCAEGTVKVHVTAVLRALGVSSRAKVIAASIDQTPEPWEG